MPRRHHDLWWLAPCLVVLAFAAYGATLGDGFLADDYARVHEAHNAPSAWHALRLYPGAGERMFVRPLLNLSFWIDHHLLGAGPLGYRLVNLGLHILNAFLVALLVREASHSARAAWLASLAFVIFPLHAEAVVWISGRVDVLCTTGCLVALVAWQRFIRPDHPWKYLFVANAAFVAGLLGKEMAITVPLLALALVWHPGRRLDRRTWIGGATFAAVVVVYLVARFAILGGLGGYRGPDGASFHTPQSLESVARYVVRAFRFLAVPTNRELHPALWDPGRVGPVLALVTAWTLALVQSRSRTWNLTWRGVLLVLVALLPVAGWAVLPDDNSMTRMLYLPSVFFCATVGGVLALAWEQRPKGLAVAAAVLLLSSYLLGSVRAALTWHETSEIVREDIARIHAACDGRTEGVELVVTGFEWERLGTQLWSNGFFAGAAWMPANVTRATVLGEEEWSRRVALGQATAESPRIFLRRSNEAGVVRALSPAPKASRTNNLGFYDDEDTPPKPRENGVRVLVAGDANLVSVDSNRESFAGVLEQLLDERFGARFEVLNAGAAGAAPADFLLSHVDLEPALFVLVLGSGRIFLDAGRPGGIENAEERRAFERALRAAVDVNSAAVEEALHQVSYLKAFPAAAAASMRLVQEQLRAVREACDANGIALLLVLLPAWSDTRLPLDEKSTLAAMDRLGLDPADLGRGRELALTLFTWARSGGIDCVDLHDAFLREPEPCFRALDRRLSARGHRLAAESVIAEGRAHFERLTR